MEERYSAFTVLIGGISRSIHKIKTEEMSEFCLRSSHVSCLYYLYKAGSLTAKELCDICEEDKANISRAVKYLEENGFVTCRSAAQKRYQSPLELTDKGREIGAQIVSKIDRILEAASKGLCDGEREVLYRSLALINKNLKDICEGYGADEQ